MSEHIREATTPIGSMTEGEGGIILADCSCGGTYSIPQGGGEREGDRLDAAHAEHVAPFERWAALRDYLNERAAFLRQAGQTISLDSPLAAAVNICLVQDLDRLLAKMAEMEADQ